MGEEADRDKRPCPDKRISPAQFDEEEQDIEGDQGVRDYGNCPAIAVVVTNGKHPVLLSCFRGPVSLLSGRQTCGPYPGFQPLIG
jgi:hypothetical protein